MTIEEMHKISKIPTNIKSFDIDWNENIFIVNNEEISITPIGEILLIDLGLLKQVPVYEKIACGEYRKTIYTKKVKYNEGSRYYTDNLQKLLHHIE